MGISPTAERPVITAPPTAPIELRRRERERFGRRIQWETVFFGLLAAVGLAALLVAMLLGGLVAAGVTDFRDNAATFFDHLTMAGGGVAVAIIALSYLTGGYVAARMARFDGWRQGLGIWLLSLLMVVAVAIAAWIGGGTLDPTESISLPSNPVDTGPLSHSGWTILAVVLAVSLVAAVAGGILGERYHRAVDDAAFEPDEREAEPEPEPEPETEVDSDDQPYGPDRVRQDAPASAASSSEESTASPAARP
jgi:hypothetical protein